MCFQSQGGFGWPNLFYYLANNLIKQTFPFNLHGNYLSTKIGVVDDQPYTPKFQPGEDKPFRSIDPIEKE